MLQHDRRIIHSSEESNWRTPPECFAALDREFDFQIDAAADAQSALCPTWFGPGSDYPDALTRGWYGTLAQDSVDIRVTWDATRFFLNPPYSKTQYRLTRDPAFLIENWARKCWEESQAGCTIVGIFPFSPQTEWYRRYIMGHGATADQGGKDPAVGGWSGWAGHAAMEERRLPHRISFLRPDGTSAGNAGVNSVIIVWKPNCGIVGPWQPHTFYWSYR